eukprot:scaffold356531_cov106-Cyclotella_meneghiniana.AAC.1
MKLSLALFATILGSAAASSPARERIAQRHLAEAERRELMEERELMSMSMSMSMTDDATGSAGTISAGVAAGAAVIGAIALL